MNEKNFIIYKFLNKTYFYLFIQKIMGGKTAREKIIAGEFAAWKAMMVVQMDKRL